MNKVFIIGRLTREPEKTVTSNGTSICKFGVAVNNGYGDNKKVAFIDVTAWAKTADFIDQYFGKGKEILIEGRLEFDQWEDKDGKKRSKLYVTCEKGSFVGSKDQDSKDEAKHIEKINEGVGVEQTINNDDIPF